MGFTGNQNQHKFYILGNLNDIILMKEVVSTSIFVYNTFSQPVSHEEFLLVMNNTNLKVQLMTNEYNLICIIILLLLLARSKMQLNIILALILASFLLLVLGTK